MEHAAIPETGVDLLRLPNTQTYNLQLGQELRFEIAITTTSTSGGGGNVGGDGDGEERVHVWCSNGNVEIFGFPLSNDRVYHFNAPASLGILCISGGAGAKIYINGAIKEGAYVATVESTRNHMKYLNLHSYFEKRRCDAYRRNLPGPCVLLVGAPRSGKSSLLKTFINYAVRSRPQKTNQPPSRTPPEPDATTATTLPEQWTPLFVDLDCCKPDLSPLPGTFSMANIVVPCESTAIFPDNCLIYSIPFGYTRPKPNNMIFYQDRLQYLAEVAHARQKTSRIVAASGMFISVCDYRSDLLSSSSSSSSSSSPLEYIVHAANAFRATDILVMDNARLSHLLQNRYKQAPSDVSPIIPEIADLPKSKGVLESTDADEEAKEYQVCRIRSYFEGIPGSSISESGRFPYPFDVPFSEVKLCRAGVLQETVKNSMLAIDVDFELLQKTLIEIQPARNMAGHVFALMSAWNKEEVLKAGILGFLVLKAVNMQAKTITFSSIRPKSEVPIKTHYLFYTELEYED